METIDDIIAELRYHNGETLPPWVIFNEDGGLDITLLADRIESAGKALIADRDNWRRQALDEDARADATHKDYLAVGNMAAMRKALENIIHHFCTNCPNDGPDGCELSEVEGRFEFLCHKIKQARSALSAPPRNIDRINNYDDMANAWNDYVWHHSNGIFTLDGFFVWLFDKTKGETK